jgi:hypothetical protein
MESHTPRSSLFEQFSAADHSGGQHFSCNVQRSMLFVWGNRLVAAAWPNECRGCQDNIFLANPRCEGVAPAVGMSGGRASRRGPIRAQTQRAMPVSVSEATVDGIAALRNCLTCTLMQFSSVHDRLRSEFSLYLFLCCHFKLPF